MTITAVHLLTVSDRGHGSGDRIVVCVQRDDGGAL